MKIVVVGGISKAEQGAIEDSCRFASRILRLLTVGKGVTDCGYCNNPLNTQVRRTGVEASDCEGQN